MRPPDQLEYVPEPDKSEEAAEGMGRLFWYSVEFGLIREAGGLRVYGSGLISSRWTAARA